MIDRPLIFLHGRHIPKCREHFAKEYKDYCTIQYIADGAVHLELDDEAYGLFPGRMWSARPGRHMSFRPLRPDGWWEHRYLAFRGALAYDWVAADLLPSRPLTVPARLDVPARIDGIMEAAKRPERWSQLRAIDRLELLLVDVAQFDHRLRTEEDGSVNNVLETINAVVARGEKDGPDYDAMAADMGISTATLQRRFRRLTGLTLHEYYIQVRLASAQSLLADTDKSVGEIAQELGYRDGFYFARQFRDRIGAAPTDYRRSFRLRKS